MESNTLRANLPSKFTFGLILAISLISCSNQNTLFVPPDVEEHAIESTISHTDFEPCFYVPNLSNEEAKKIGNRLLSKLDFSIFKTLGYCKENYISAYHFDVEIHGMRISFRAIDCYYRDLPDITIYASQGPILNADVSKAPSFNTSPKRTKDFYEYNNTTNSWELVARRYEFNTSLPEGSSLRTCWVVIEGNSIRNFERFFLNFTRAY